MVGLAGDIKRRSILGGKAMTNKDKIRKDFYDNNDHNNKAAVFPMVIYGY